MGDESRARNSPAPIQITVFNQTYRVVATDGGERATRIARLVDARMREIASQITTHEVAKIAVLAALNLADDLLTLQETQATQGTASAAPDEGVIDPPSEATDAQTPARGSWFEAVFDGDLGSAERRAGRMSSAFAERFKSARQPGEVASAGERKRESEDESLSGNVRRVDEKTS